MTTVKTLLAILRHGLDVWNRLGKVEERVSELRKEQDRVNALLERLSRESQHDHDTAKHERELLLLQVENMMLKFERRLPPAKPAKDK